MNRALGIDHGDARIGLAVSDELGMLAHPLETMYLKEIADPVAHIADVVTKHKIAQIVLGLPRNMDGTYGPASEKVRAFAEKLKAATPCPVKLWDERLTSVAAQRSLHEAGRNVKNSRAVIDQVAAQMILQGWLDAQAMLGG
jgi:putative Holliday junction resolvase